MTVKQLVALLAMVFLAVGIGTVVLLRNGSREAGMPDGPATTSSASSSSNAPSSAELSTTKTPDPNAPQADYLYLLPKKIVLMRGDEVVASAPRVFDTADTHRNKVVWTANGDHVALLSDANLRGKPPTETELIAINTRSGVVQRLPCRNCQDVAAIGDDEILASVFVSSISEDYLRFDLGKGGSAGPIEFPRAGGGYRYILGSTRERAVTVQYDPNGARSRTNTHRLTMAKVGTVSGRNIGHFGANAYLPFAATEGPSGAKFAFASRVDPGLCYDLFPIFILTADGTPAPTDMSSIYPQGTVPGSTSGIEVHDLWWAPDGKLRASITSFKCPAEAGANGRRVPHKPPTRWRLDGEKWVDEGIGPAEMVRDLRGGTRIELNVPECTDDAMRDPDFVCNTGQLVRTSEGKRTVVAEKVLWIATPPTAAPAPASTVTSSPSQGVAASAISPFVGVWTQHAGGIEVKSNGTVAMSYQAASVPVSFPKLTLKIVEAAGSKKAIAVVETSEDNAVPSGSRMTLELKHPGIVTTLASGEQTRWCDPEQRTAGECGA